mgnify:CR=1 FL=1
MDEEKKWMLMTYYCPTHGDSGMIKPIEITKKEITKTFQKLSLIHISEPTRPERIGDARLGG